MGLLRKATKKKKFNLDLILWIIQKEWGKKYQRPP